MTLLELLTDFWEDYYQKNPVDAKRLPSGEVMFQTGDPLLDKWERELAEGLEPDLMEGLSPEERAKEERAREKFSVQFKKKQEEEEKLLGDGFDDNYVD